MSKAVEPYLISAGLDSSKINLINFWTLYSKNKRYFLKTCEKYNLHIFLQLDEGRGRRSLTASLCEPLLHAALEEREVWVPVNMLHSRMNAHGHVPASIQRLQPKRVVPVELSEWKKRKNASIGRSFKSLITCDLFLSWNLHWCFSTYILILHFYDFFTAVIETKVAAWKKMKSVQVRRVSNRCCWTALILFCKLSLLIIPIFNQEPFFPFIAVILWSKVTWLLFYLSVFCWGKLFLSVKLNQILSHGRNVKRSRVWWQDGSVYHRYFRKTVST